MGCNNVKLLIASTPFQFIIMIFFSGKSLVSDFSDLFVMRKNAHSKDNWNYNNILAQFESTCTFSVYIYFFNFVFFIVLSRIEINETHVNPYLLEPLCLLLISSSLSKIWCMFYTSCVVKDVWEFICSCTRSNKSGKGWGMMKWPVFCGGQQLQTYTQIHGCFSFRCRVYT